MSEVREPAKHHAVFRLRRSGQRRRKERRQDRDPFLELRLHTARLRLPLASWKEPSCFPRRPPANQPMQREHVLDLLLPGS